MNPDEAKAILLLYRHGTADAEDPQIAGALAVARQDEVLARWLEKHCAQQMGLREKFRQLRAPAGLREQIISEQAASERPVSFWRRKTIFVPVAAMILLSGLIASLWLVNQRGHEDTLDIFQSRMAGVALRGYGMDFTTNDPAQIRAYLAQHDAPADFVLPEALQQVSLAGCAIQGWQGVKVSMLCFRSRQAAPDVSSDVWLFVVDRTSVKKLPAGAAPQLSKVNRLMTATWIQGDKLYFLGTAGDAQTIQHYL